jgi:YihY family inner membrane protein
MAGPEAATGDQRGARGDRGSADSGNAAVARAKRLVRWADDYQRRHEWAGFPFAVLKKFGDDSAGNLAALIAYYGFFSLFPLMLVFVTGLGFALHGHPALQQRVVTSTLSQFPVIGDQLRQNVHSLSGSGLALAFGIAGTLWGGLGVGSAAQTAFNDVWAVPVTDRPNFVGSLWRNLALLAVIGLGTVATTTLSGVGSGSSAAGLTRVAAVLVAVWLDVGMFLVAFRIASAVPIAWRDLLLGATVAGVAWEALQLLGAYYVAHELKGASQVYGTFAVVIGLLSWLYLEAQVTLLALEIDVVRARGLWPRAVSPPPLTPADRRAYRTYAERDQYRPEEDVDVDFPQGSRRPT